jgi:hypothetical protein
MRYDRYGRRDRPSPRTRHVERVRLQRRRSVIVRAVETLTLLLAATVLFMWVIFAHPTPEERSRLHDSMGQSTGIAWR